MHRHVVVAIVIIGFVACVVVAVFILPRDTEHTTSIKRGGIYRIVIPSAPIVLDPIRSDWPLSLQLLHAINATLVRVDANGNIVPHIATSWTVDAERKLYRFRIRDDAHFHNGKNVTIDDVIGSLKRTLNPESLYRDNLRMVVGYDSLVGANGQGLEGIRKLGPREFEIALQYPFEPFLTMLTSISFSILPIHEVQADPNFFEAPIGAGAFRWKKSTSANEFLLEAFEGYFLGRAYLDGVSFRVVDDSKKRGALLSRGEVEQVYSFGGESFIAEDDEYIQIPMREMRVYVLSFNTTKAPFNTRKAREAFRCALNFQNIQSYLHVYPNIQSTESYIPKGMLGYDPDIGWPYCDRQSALKNLPEKNSRTKSPLRFVTRLPKPAGEIIIHEVRRAVTSLGFELTIDDEWLTLEQELSQGVNADIFFIGYAPNFPDSFFLLNYFHSASIGSTNGARFREERYDTLLDTAVRTEDYSARAHLYRELNQLLVDEAIVIPVYSGSANTGVFKKYIRGLEFPHANLPFPLLERVWLNS